MYRVGYIDDEPTQFENYKRALRRRCDELELVLIEDCETKRDILNKIYEKQIDVLLIDYKMVQNYGFNGTTLINYINDSMRDIQCFIMTGVDPGQITDGLVAERDKYSKNILVLVRKWGDGKLKSRLWDIKFVTIKSSKRRMTFMDDDNRIKLADLISKLPQEAVDALYKAAASLLGTASNKDNPACPYCGGHHVVKNGHKCGKQEYLCRQCGKTFVSTTHTLMAHSHQPKQVWEAVLMDTLAGDAIDYSAKQLEISHDCVFYMRHKILLGLHGLLEETGVCLGGVSELDETFVLDSYKGGSLPEDAARPARRHGAKAQKRGISDEYVCICTGVERKGDAIAGSINRAKPSSRELGKMFKGHIKEGTLVLCDGLKSYLALEKDTGCSVKDVTEERSGKFFNLNTVNNFHSFIKSRYKFYRGVATKYLNRYNDLFSIAYRQAREKAGQLCNQLLEVSSINRNYTNRDVKMRGLLDI